MDLLERVVMVIPLILSLSVHEWAHAYSAFRLGDDTAARLGRMTLNPLSHIDPIGTLLLPLLGVPFGWAKPVPVNPVRFSRKVQMRTGMMITAAAGPFSNVVLAVLCIVFMGLAMRFAPHAFSDNPAIHLLLVMGFKMNVALALFNMLPIPPLDGSRVADGLMPLRFRPLWERIEQYAPLALLAVVFFSMSLLRWPLDQAFQIGSRLIDVIVEA